MRQLVFAVDRMQLNATYSSLNATLSKLDHKTAVKLVDVTVFTVCLDSMVAYTTDVCRPIGCIAIMQLPENERRSTADK
jgi:hypothetical protein